MTSSMDDASARLARVEDWLRVARGEDIGHVQVRCTWSEIADDLEFHVYPERSTDGQADADREGQQQAEAGAGVGPGPAESVGSPYGELACMDEWMKFVGDVPTLGEIASVLEKLKSLGVTRGVAMYCLNRVWWELDD